GWVKLEEKWHNPELVKLWEELRKTRTEVNKVLEKARAEKAIGAPLEAKVLLYVKDTKLREQIQVFHPLANAEKTKSEFVEAKIEIEPEKAENTTPNKSQKSSDDFDKNQENLSDSSNKISKLFSVYKKALGGVFLLVILLFSIKLALIVVNTIDQLPVVNYIMILVGIIYTIYFITQNLLFAKSRKSFLEKIKFAAQDILGQETLLGNNKKLADNTIKQSTTLVSPEGVFVPSQKVEFTPEIQVVETETLPQQPNNIKAMIPGNGVDELRYLFITSAVELLESPEALTNLEYKSISDSLGIGVVKADGKKCDRCWNYSTHVGVSSEDPTICERCVAALAAEF
ncbi:MAG: isoleucine--tRNA ligase, partial [Trichodesmium sp. MAG_R03]|nr:isoleucine--tRNA ligase [Trichodesmium sp. MAG_R03]